MKVGPDGWLVEDAEGLPPVLRVPSVRTADLASDIPNPLGLVWHWTGGHARNTIYAKALADEIRTFDRTKDRAASWHVLIAKDGTILQSIPFNRGAWHVGKPGRIAGRLFGNINRATVGCELCNAGELKLIGGKFYCWPYFLHPDHPEQGPDPQLEILSDRAIHVDAAADGSLEAGWYDDFPREQRQAAQRLAQALALAFNIQRDDMAWGHVDFDSPRKMDPGPLWRGRYLPMLLDLTYGPR